MTMNNMHVIHMLVYSSIKNIFRIRKLVSGMSTVCKDTNGCANQYRCALDIY